MVSIAVLIDQYTNMVGAALNSVLLVVGRVTNVGLLNPTGGVVNPDTVAIELMKSSKVLEGLIFIVCKDSVLNFCEK